MQSTLARKSELTANLPYREHVTPTLTIAIPTRNRQKYLAELLPTVISQAATVNKSHKVVEIIIVDNHSSDSTQEYITNNYTNNLTYHRNESNIGADANFIECVQKSTGRYVWLFGDDEILNKHGINIILEKLKSNPALIIAISEFKETMEFKNYKRLLEYTTIANPMFPIHHTLITANIFPRQAFNIATARIRKPTSYGHMYAITNHIANAEGIIVLGKSESAIAVRDTRAEFDSPVPNIRWKLTKYSFHLGISTHHARVVISTWLHFYPVRIMTKISRSKKIKRIINYFTNKK